MKNPTVMKLRVIVILTFLTVLCFCLNGTCTPSICFLIFKPLYISSRVEMDVTQLTFGQLKYLRFIQDHLDESFRFIQVK